LGDVYFAGAVGSIVGTFLAGYVLIYAAPTSTIVTVVAAALAALAAAMLGGGTARVIGLAAAATLGLGALPPLVRLIPLPGVPLGGVAIPPLALVGHALALALGVTGVYRLLTAGVEDPAQPETETDAAEAFSHPEGRGRPRLGDLAALSFVASLTF